MINKKNTSLGRILLIFTCFYCTFVYSEVTLDGSMGTAGALPGPDFQITEALGQRAGSNLFHSFGQFNLNNTESATFSGSPDIQNVISRVTGGQASNIDGALRSTIPDANVFFLNPTGVIFGENASLDVQGSFHASTADYLKFKDGVKFESGIAQINPTLSTAAPEAFGFLDNTPANISVSGGNNKVLEVPKDATLSLIGGDITIKDRSLYAPSGQIILASVGSAGEVIAVESGIDTSSFTKMGNININHAANNPVTIIDQDVKIADIDVSADSGGKVFIRGGQMVMENANIWARTINKDGSGIDIALTDDLTLNGVAERRDVEVTPNSGIGADSQGEGNAGNIVLDVDELKLTHGTFISSSSKSLGNGGDLLINANSVLLEGNDSNTIPRIVTKTSGTGNAGNINITSHNSLEVSKGAFIHSSTTEKGNTGAITVNTGTLELYDKAIISNKVTESAVGSSEDITINAANSVEIHNNAIIANDTDGKGDAGDLKINANNLQIKESSILSRTTGSGNGGNLLINANSTQLENRGSISISSLRTSTTGAGDAGDISITANKNLEVRNDGAYIRSFTTAKGNTGAVTIITGSLELYNNAQINSKVSETAIGSSADLTINAIHSINLNNNSIIGNGTDGKGNAGGVIINSDSIDISGNSGILNISNGLGNTGNVFINSNSLKIKSGDILNHTNNIGNAGDLAINTGSLELADGTIGSNSALEAMGQNGNISIKAKTILLEGDSFETSGKISGTVFDNKITGNLTVIADKLEINDWAGISLDNFGAGNTGDLLVKADEIVMANTAGGFNGISANLNGDGNSGDLKVESQNLLIVDGGSIEIINLGNGNSGTLSVEASEDIELHGTSTFIDKEGNPKAIFSNISNVAFSSGRVEDTFISANQNILVNDSAQINTTATASANGGNLTIKADHFVVKEFSQIKTAAITLPDKAPVTGDGGDLKIDVNHLEINNAIVSTLNDGNGNAGDIIIQANNIEMNDDASLSTSTTGAGKAGNLTIVADNLLLDNKAVITTLSTFVDFNNLTEPDTAMSGDINITAKDLIRLEKNSSISSQTDKAHAGIIKINGEALLQLHDDSRIQTKVSDGQGQGGDIFIDNPIVALDNSFISAQAVNGAGGNITISGFLFQSPLSFVTASSELNVDGQLNLKPETNISGSLTVLPESLLNASEHLTNRCVSRFEENKNSFVVKSQGGVPISPGELTPSNFLDYKTIEENTDVTNFSHENNKLKLGLKDSYQLSSHNIPCN